MNVPLWEDGASAGLYPEIQHMSVRFRRTEQNSQSVSLTLGVADIYI